MRRHSLPLRVVVLVAGVVASGAVLPASAGAAAGAGSTTVPSSFPLAASRFAAGADDTYPPLEVIFLANEGVLLRAGDDAVLIDAFVPEVYSGYGRLPDDVWARMQAAEAPFDSVDLALVSHVHRDHFQAAAAAAFLAASPGTEFLSSPEVGTRLRATDGAAALENRIGEVWPGKKEELSIERDGIQVDFLHLSHGSGRFARIQNLGHVIHLGGRRILHVGDAASSGASFGAYRLRQRRIDVALIPYWYFYSEAGRRVIKRYLRAPLTVAVHIPPAELDEARQGVARADAGVVILEKAGDFRQLPPVARTPDKAPVAAPEGPPETAEP